MMKKSLLGSIAAALLVVAGFALAQAPGVPSLMIASPTGEEQIRVENTGPQIAIVKLTQIRDASAYQIITEASTNPVQQGNDVAVITFTGATAGTATITTEATPVDGQRLLIFSIAGITSLTMTGAGSQTFANAPASIAALGNVEFIYQASTLTWYRIQ